MAENQVYLIKSGQNSFVEETQAIVGISGGKVGIGTTVPEADFHVAGSAQIDGDLTVKGNFTTVESTTIQVDDKNIELGVGSTTDVAADGGGITLHGATNKTFNWIDATNAWTSSEHLHLAAGKRFAADGIRALGAGGLSVGDDAGNGIFVQDGGRVGIATTNPGYDLDVNGSGNFDSLYIQGNSVLTGDGSIFGKWEDATTAGEIYYNGGNVGVGVVDPSAQLHVVGTTLLNGDVSASTIKAIDAGGLTLGDDAGNGIFVEDGGQVGVNTISPNYNLHVNGTTHIGGDFSVGSEFKISAGGAIGGTAPASDGDIIKWDDTNNKWVAGANLGGGGGGGVGEVPAAIINSLPSGQSIYEIDFAETYNVEPRIATQLEIDGEGSIIPYVVSGVSTSGYHLIFAQDIPNNNYRIHTTFGGRDVHWETGSSASLYYNDGDVSIQRNFTIGGNLTVNGTTTTVNTETVEIEDHNLVIAANTGYNQLDSQYPAGGAYAGILWGTGDAGSASPVSLTYQTNKGFAFEGGNVGVGTTNPGAKLEIQGTSANSEYLRMGGTNSSANRALRFSSFNSGADDSGHIINAPSSGGEIQFQTNSANVMRIDASGNVGIGTTNPDRLLHVSGGSASALAAKFETASTNGSMIVFKDADTTTNDLQVRIGSDANHLVQYAGGSERMRITSDGNVGIGITVPNVRFEVEDDLDTAYVASTTGGTRDAQSVLQLSNASTTESSAALIQFEVNVGAARQLANIGVVDDGDTFAPSIVFSQRTDSSNQSERMRIDPAGNVGIGTTNPDAGLHVFSSGNGELEVERSSGAKINLQAQSAFAAIGTESNHDFGIKANSAVVMRLTTSGRVGVGTTAPSSKFHIRGDGSAETKLTVDSGTTSHAASISFTADSERAKILGGYQSGGGGFIKFNTDTVGGTAADRMIINNEGNVGIGTANPQSRRLNIHGDSESTVSVASITRNQASAANNTYTLQVDSSVHTSNLTSAGAMSVDVNSGRAFTINGFGNVGIGTTNPGANLHVNGNNFILGGGHLSSSPQNGLIIAPYGEGTDIGGGDLNVYAGRSTGTGAGGDITFLTSPAGESSGEGVNAHISRLKITSNGNVGIGTTNPRAKFEVANAASNSALLFNVDTGENSKAAIQCVDEDAIDNKRPLLLNPAGGNVGIGTTDPSEHLSIVGMATLKAFSVNTPQGRGFEILLGDSIGSTGPTLQTNTVAGFNMRSAATGFMTLGVGTEHMRIDSSGNVLIGKNTTSAGTRGCYINSNGTFISAQPNGGDAATFFTTFNSSEVGSIELTTTATNYNTSSDYRLKTDVQPITGAVERLKALKPVNFEWIADGTRVDGFLAHEAQEIVPEAVTGTKDAMQTEEYEVTPAVYEDIIIPATDEVVDEDGNVITEAQEERTEQKLVSEAVMGEREVPDYQGIDQSKLVPLLTAAIQEQQAIIEQLKSQNASLESRISALES